MAKFVRKQFDYHGGYLHYTTDAGERKFIARFKHDAGDRAPFTSFLIKNYTVEEYLAAYNDGAGEAPLAILREKGYISNNMKKALKAAGVETMEEWHELNRKMYEARRAAQV